MKFKWAPKELFSEYADALGVRTDEIMAAQKDPDDPDWAFVMFSEHGGRTFAGAVLCLDEEGRYQVKDRMNYGSLRTFRAMFDKIEELKDV